REGRKIMLIDGKQLAEKIIEDLTKKVRDLEQSSGIIPHLAIILVGDDPASIAYVGQKEKMGKQIGAVVSTYKYPLTISEKELLEHVEFLQNKTDIHGLIVQLPLPKHLDEQIVTNAVNREKDVDGFREDSLYPEPIAAAAIKILEEAHNLELEKGKTKTIFTEWLKEKNVVVMGKGKTGGKPIIDILKEYGVEPTVVDSKTKNASIITASADILVCAVGKGTFVHPGMIKKDAILLGIGMHRGNDGKLHGDYDGEEIKDKAAYYTPVPGGVGPVNAAELLVNVVDAAEKHSHN
ncbi:MAG: bifunctional 5,10-methylenetetrahydrofolate dehydrogenase/5,10-methenyltetrahydrofolate cyclohydrolase, partial [Candidatus Levyibacteriota bacterium]